MWQWASYIFSFDASHLIKSPSNNLLNGDFSYEQNRVFLDDIRDVYNTNKASSTGKALLKITDIHIQPNNFQKINDISCSNL